MQNLPSDPKYRTPDGDSVHQSARCDFGRISFVLLATALTATTSSSCQAAGSFQKPAVREVVTAGIAPSRQASQCPTSLQVISLAAAVGVESAITIHMVAVA